MIRRHTSYTQWMREWTAVAESWMTNNDDDHHEATEFNGIFKSSNWM